MILLIGLCPCLEGLLPRVTALPKAKESTEKRCSRRSRAISLLEAIKRRIELKHDSPYRELNLN